jgi:cbb3-type cytochrome oxidase subunit 3
LALATGFLAACFLLTFTGFLLATWVFLFNI